MRSIRLAALTAAGLSVLTLAGCGGDGKSGNASSASASSGDRPNGEVRFGIEPYEAPAKLTPAYQVLAKALEERLGCPVKLQIVQDYAAEVLAMRNGQLDLAEFGPLGFVFASQRANAEPVASFGDASGKLSSYKAGIWVAKDSPIHSIEQLKGHSLALAEPGSTSGDAMPRYALKQAGLSQSDVKIDYTGGHPESLLALTHGKVDAAELNTQQRASAESANQFDAADYRQVWASDPIPNDPITVDGQLPSAFKIKVKRALMQLQPDAVEKVGAFLDVDPAGPMVSVSKDTYKPLFDLASSLGLTQKDAG